MTQCKGDALRRAGACVYPAARRSGVAHEHAFPCSCGNAVGVAALLSGRVELEEEEEDGVEEDPRMSSPVMMS